MWTRRSISIAWSIAARRDSPWCSAIASLICRPTVSSGLSEVIGSWKIIEMSLPRIASISLSLSSSRFVPSNRMAPPTIRPGGSATRRRMDSAVTLLPQPDSPTTPSVSPRRARHRRRRRPPAPTPAAVKKWVWRLSISSSGCAGARRHRRRALSTAATSFKSDSLDFGVILMLRRLGAIRARRARS